MTMERTNLLNMAKLSIKGLIESGLSFGRTLDSDYPPLQQFFVVMEHCLKHGLKGEKGRQRKQMQKKIPLTAVIIFISATASSSFLVFSQEVLSGLQQVSVGPPGAGGETVS